jgi:hypothetical protein
VTVFGRRLLHAEKLIGHAKTHIQALLVAIDDSEMSNVQEAIENLRKLLPKLAAFLGEI